MQPLFYRYFIPFDIGEPSTGSAVDQINNARVLLHAGAISQSTAHGLLGSVLNTGHIRDTLISVGLHELTHIMDYKQDYMGLPDDVLAQLWKSDITERALMNWFANRPVMVIPVYEHEAPKGYDVDKDVSDVLKTLAQEHKFIGEIYGVLKEPYLAYNADQKYKIEPIEFSPPKMTFRFEDEGDAVVVTAFKDDLDRQLAETASQMRMTMGLGSGASPTFTGQGGMSQGPASNTARVASKGSGLLQAMSNFGVSSRGTTKRPPP